MSKENATPTNVPAKQLPTPSERFTNSVLANFTTMAGGAPQVTNFQKKLIQNYFIKLDMALKTAEQKRMAKDDKFRDQLAFDWNNVNMPKLALDVVAYASIGMDPMQPNHINLIPYKNNASGKYDITFMMGYQGLQLKAKKYGYDVPDQVIVEIVYSTDTFEQIKKDIDNPIEGYRFKVNNDFERGTIVGGFYYFIYKSNPEKNKLKVFSYADILKRRPDSASPEFWGGEKDEWKDGKKTGKKIEIEGWHEEMCYKTIARAAYNAIAIDSEKIDEHLLNIIQKESEYMPSIQDEIKTEIAENSGAKTITIPVAESEPVNKQTGELFEDKKTDGAPF
jgi:recombination protein RecT